MEKSKHFRTGLKKIPKRSLKNNLSLTVQDTEHQLIDHEPTITNQIVIKLTLFDEYVQSGQLKYLADVLNVLEHIDKTLLKCLDNRIEVLPIHTIESSSQYNTSIINVYLEIKTESKYNALASLHEFMHRGRHTILTHDYNNPNFFSELVRKLTEMAIDIDRKIDPFDDWCPTKNIDLVSLAYSIEGLSKLKKHRKNNFVFGINSPFGNYDVSPIGHHKALKLLGGLTEGKNISEYNFIVKTVNFENIQSKLIFLLDGKSVNVYIYDKKWIKKFNDKKIQLTKGMRLKSKFKILKSPLTQKIVAYLLTDIYDPDEIKS